MFHRVRQGNTIIYVLRTNAVRIMCFAWFSFHWFARRRDSLLQMTTHGPWRGSSYTYIFVFDREQERFSVVVVNCLLRAMAVRQVVHFPRFLQSHLCQKWWCFMTLRKLVPLWASKYLPLSRRALAPTAPSSPDVRFQTTSDAQNADTCFVKVDEKGEALST